MPQFPFATLAARFTDDGDRDRFARLCTLERSRYATPATVFRIAAKQARFPVKRA